MEKQICLVWQMEASESRENGMMWQSNQVWAESDFILVESSLILAERKKATSECIKRHYTAEVVKW